MSGLECTDPLTQEWCWWYEGSAATQGVPIIAMLVVFVLVFGILAFVARR